MMTRFSILLLLSLAACGTTHDDAPHAPHEMPATPAAPANPAEHAHPAAPPASPDGRSLWNLDADLTLVDQTGAPFALASLAGKPTLLTFFYSGCTTMCPLIVTDVKRIEAAVPAALRERVNVVFITIDPEHDTAPRLLAVAAERSMPARWRLVTGDASSIRTVASTVGMTYRALPSGEFAHAALYTVLGPDGRVVHQLAGTGASIDETVATLTRLAEHDPS